LTELSVAAWRLSFKAKGFRSKCCNLIDRTWKERPSQSGVKPPHSKVERGSVVQISFFAAAMRRQQLKPLAAKNEI
jgi:hypothetical protein